MDPAVRSTGSHPLTRIRARARLATLRHLQRPNASRCTARTGSSCEHTVQVVCVRRADIDLDKFADGDLAASGLHIHHPVDLGSIRNAASEGYARAGFVDQHTLASTDLSLQPTLGDRLLHLH